MTGPEGSAGGPDPSGAGGPASRASAGFDRIKPPARRVQERTSGPRKEGREPDAEGRAALFSAAPGAADRGQPARGPRVHCSRCDAVSALDARTAVRAVLPLALVNPWRDHPVFAVCPACRHRAWLRVDVR